ncbi:putative acetyltransferase At3g50280 [Silene latifolia]|uniref:putative acetyltransferase At3g50280 n=1 Tax=Silene latifolia TaxID=37657 RepID=UPI003D76B621
MNSANVKQVSQSFIKPKYNVQNSKEPYYLAPMDLSMLSLQYIQQDLMFLKPSHFTNNGQLFSIYKFLDTLKDSLSQTLVHFSPLAGRLVTHVDENRHESVIFVDCVKGPGARFIHATLDLTISHVLPVSNDIPSVVHSFFDHNEAVNHDGHDQPLLSVQVTELLDGVFIGCSINHTILDGTSYWHFMNLWSEIHNNYNKGSNKSVLNSHLPVHNRWFPDNCEKIFKFSSRAVARLKSQARNQSGNNKISSLQALTALVWRTIVRSKPGLTHDHLLKCVFVGNYRSRLNPKLPENYFGNCTGDIECKVTVKEMVEQDLGWVASLLNQAVGKHNDSSCFRESIKAWLNSPSVLQAANLFDSNSLTITHSPRFDMYGNEFGLGKAVAVRSGYGYKFGGVVAAYPGCYGEGSIDLEICLPLNTMIAIQSDEEFMDAVS